MNGAVVRRCEWHGTRPDFIASELREDLQQVEPFGKSLSNDVFNLIQLLCFGDRWLSRGGDHSQVVPKSVEEARRQRELYRTLWAREEQTHNEVIAWNGQRVCLLTGLLYHEACSSSVMFEELRQRRLKRYERVDWEWAREDVRGDERLTDVHSLIEMDFEERVQQLLISLSYFRHCPGHLGRERLP